MKSLIFQSEELLLHSCILSVNQPFLSILSFQLTFKFKLQKQTSTANFYKIFKMTQDSYSVRRLDLWKFMREKHEIPTKAGELEDLIKTFLFNSTAHFSIVYCTMN